MQEVLGHCTAELAEAGVLYPLQAEVPRPGTIENHEHAMYGLLGTEFPWVGEARSAELREGWDHLSERVREWPGTVLLSAEALAVIRTPAIRRLLDTLEVPDLDILVTARSLGRSLPSLWQQHIRNGRAGTFDDYLQVLAAQRDRPDEVERDRELHLWRAFALGRLVRRWATEAGPDRVRVVTNSGSPPQLLWSRFTQAAGLADAAARPSTEVLGKRTHAGLTADETIMLGSLNYAMSQASWSREEAARVRDTVVNDGFLTRDQRGPKNVIPESWRPRVARWSREDVRDLLDAGVEVVGDVADLRYEPAGEFDKEPNAKDVSRAGAVAVLAVAAALKQRPAAPALVAPEPRQRRLFRPKASR
ncbi:MAG: hypothetical protein JWN52_2705 [Actinomycetia bacterium]|nr:hypothetical protein [Actinomycetes bacterium]